MPELSRSRFIIGSRRSRLAMAQSEVVAERVRTAWPGLVVEIVGVETEGDRSIDRPLPEIGGKGLFTAELERRILRGEIDAAVHSLKDLPTDLAAGLCLACVPERSDAADLLIRREGRGGLEDLPAGSVLGTSSLRRVAQLLARRPDCEVRSIRGNVETRLRKCRDGEYDAIILAAAGLRRLGLPHRHLARLEPPEWLPAVGQGALGVEARASDEESARLLAAIESREARTAVECERSLLAALGGGCQIPVGAFAEVEGPRLRAAAAVFSPDGRVAIRDALSGSAFEPAAIGRALAERLLERGAGELLGRRARDPR
ncbi:MAG: hydroxymethylbilane synthase [Gemmatimonadota bacterium]